jgi:hypothetical protein
VKSIESDPIDYDPIDSIDLICKAEIGAGGGFLNLLSSLGIHWRLECF